MLTRLKVSGFKNLVDVDVSFGPFTCIAGANGVGKSNLFDAIRFLSALTDSKLIDAARVVRGGRVADARSLFHRFGEHYTKEMTFEADMIIPFRGVDDLGQGANASITFLKYTLHLGWNGDSNRISTGGLEILREDLVHINIGDAKRNLPFPHSKQWRDSAVRGRQVTPFISTNLNPAGQVIISLHQNRMEDKGGGRPANYLATNLPKTVLSEVNTTEHRTALLARREMQSWRLLQLEPSALREPDEFTAPTHIAENGAHLASALYYLEKSDGNGSALIGRETGRVYAEVANRLALLIDDVRRVDVDRDERRELLTLRVTGRNETTHSARSLSDGTLRFLALAVLERDMETQGVICLEEPENGIHPERIPAILELLRDIATDTNHKVWPEEPDNPLRQVIVNTHSPLVIQQVDPDDLLVARSVQSHSNGVVYNKVRFQCLTGTWREKQEMQAISIGELLAYLGGAIPAWEEPETKTMPTNGAEHQGDKRVRRVIDREDVRRLQMQFVFADTESV